MIYKRHSSLNFPFVLLLIFLSKKPKTLVSKELHREKRRKEDLQQKTLKPTTSHHTL
jgi:hypothetical protein